MLVSRFSHFRSGRKSENCQVQVREVREKILVKLILLHQFFLPGRHRFCHFVNNEACFFWAFSFSFGGRP